MAAKKAAKRKSAKRGRTASKGKVSRTTKRVKRQAAKPRKRQVKRSQRAPARRAAPPTSKTRPASAASGGPKRPSRSRRPSSAGPAPPKSQTTARRPVAPVVLARERRRLPESERAEPKPPEQDDRLIAAARTGHEELQQSLLDHTETSPKLTAGDVDAKWEDAYAVGDEAPGGDNPTPDQDRVDDIGRALGVQYQDNEELNPEEKIPERDRHRWELDPASAEDWPHDDKRKK